MFTEYQTESYCKLHDVFDCWFGHDPHEISINYQRNNAWMSWWGFDNFGNDESAYPLIAADGRMATGGAKYDGRDAICGSWTQIAAPAQQYGFRCSQWILLRAVANQIRANYSLVDEPF